jgi:hypothetical protein
VQDNIILTPTRQDIVADEASVGLEMTVHVVARPARFVAEYDLEPLCDVQDGGAVPRRVFVQAAASLVTEAVELKPSPCGARWGLAGRGWRAWQNVAVLEGLDAVDWGRLTHAYGAATDVPAQIRALRSSVASERERALGELYGNIFHQGTRYDATAYAVPFLLEVLASPDCADRTGLLDLLAGIAVGYDESWLPEGLPIADHRREADGGATLWAATPRPGDEDFDEDEGIFAHLATLPEKDQNRLYAHILLMSYDAVRAGLPMFRSLLKDSDPAVRVRAAYLLAWFPEEDSLPALAAVRGDHETVAATVQLAVGLLGGRPAESALDDPRAIVRCAAAIALATVDRSGSSQTVVEELLAWISSDHGGTDVPFLGGDLAGYAGLALRLTGERRADSAFDALLARIPNVSGIEALPVVGEALRMAFADGPLSAGGGYGSLDDRQRRLVDKLARSPGTWQVNGMTFGNFALLVGSYGLPSKHMALQSYINDSP